jgi:hypothetical protein
VREKRAVEFFKTLGLLIPAALIALGSFFGPIWGVAEYTAYSRGQSELASANGSTTPRSTGLDKAYAFEFSNGPFEPFTLVIPNVYGGSSSDYLVLDQQSETYKALMRSGDQQMANQLAGFSSAYWGPQRLAIPYYAGAIVVLLFFVGLAFAERKYIWWLLPLGILSILFSLGDHAQWFNYFVFDHLPGYNKFRSVTFTLVIILFAMPLLGFLGLEKLMNMEFTKQVKKKLLAIFVVVWAFLLWFIGGPVILNFFSDGPFLMNAFTFTKTGESQLPSWFMNALIDDRKSALNGDVFRSIFFMAPIFVFLYFQLYKKLSPTIFYAALGILILADLASVDKRYLKEENFKRKRESNFFVMTNADQEILKDKSYYRVYNLADPNPMAEARTSYFHNSLGGYHGAKLKRYQDLFDSCLLRETNELIRDAQSGQLDFNKYSVLNMLNTRYLVYGPDKTNIIRNPSANGNAWFVGEIIKVKSAAEELNATCSIDTRKTAVVDESKFAQVPGITPDSAATIRLIEQKPNYLKYESQSQQNSLAVFSEIYYEKGWKAFIDGTETNILRANYVLRALSVPAGKHVVEFRFEPAAFTVGNTITRICSWLMLFVLLGSIYWNLKKEPDA